MNVTRRLFFGVIGSVMVTRAARADLYDDYINSVSRQPFVSFFARDDTATGHAFVAIGTELDNGLTVYEGIYGYYPKNGTKQAMKIYVSERGVVTFKENDYPSSIKFRKNVDNNAKKKALEVFSRWNQNDPKYNILAVGGKNCNSLVKEVATSIGLKIPTENPGLVFPADYITKLKSEN